MPEGVSNVPFKAQASLPKLAISDFTSIGDEMGGWLRN